MCVYVCFNHTHDLIALGFVEVKYLCVLFSSLSLFYSLISVSTYAMMSSSGYQYCRGSVFVFSSLLLFY